MDDGERATDDWKGLIAFNGTTVCASEQTRFYPVPEDSTSGIALEAVSCRLDVSCSDCPSLYVNWREPTNGPRATFVSEFPRPLMVYTGAFLFT